MAGRGSHPLKINGLQGGVCVNDASRSDAKGELALIGR
ncbi:Uncharacterized protein pbN1_32340 [Aromatoleum bremense]|nr:Uncharacterized protein pbN1_32340 [Aromatoleum bremense]